VAKSPCGFANLTICDNNIPLRVYTNRMLISEWCLQPRFTLMKNYILRCFSNFVSYLIFQFELGCSPSFTSDFVTIQLGLRSSDAPNYYKGTQLGCLWWSLARLHHNELGVQWSVRPQEWRRSWKKGPDDAKTLRDIHVSGMPSSMSLTWRKNHDFNFLCPRPWVLPDVKTMTSIFHALGHESYLTYNTIMC